MDVNEAEAVNTNGHRSIIDTAVERPPLSANGNQVGHKRSLSGSILSRLNFLRASLEDTNPPLQLPLPPPSSSSTNTLAQHDTTRSRDEKLISPMSESAMLLAQSAAKQRKRKGSLRKTALLGTGRLRAEGRERRNSLLQRAKNVEDYSSSQTTSPMYHQSQQSAPNPPAILSEDHQQSRIPARGLLYHPPPLLPTTDIHRPVANLEPKLSLDIIRAATPPSSVPVTLDPSTLASPIVSPTSQSYTSTTDDDEVLTLPNSILKRPPIPTSGSYFPAQSVLQRRRSSKKPSSPLSAIPVNAHCADDEFDYSETEWWGWVVLIVTWIVFVVGMGSCFGLWSWAWDVGETPYAPPELEDDPTLPIVGYYPALIILTGVMAWVWVVVAWVGMKYFKHAKMAGEDA